MPLAFGAIAEYALCGSPPGSPFPPPSSGALLNKYMIVVAGGSLLGTPGNPGRLGLQVVLVEVKDG